MTTGKSTKNILRNLLTLKSVAAINGTVVSSVTITKAPATSTLKASSTATAYVAAPSPTTPGTTPYCCTWYTVVAKDSCTEIATDYGLTLEEFIALNTYVDTPCDGLWPNYSIVCLEFRLSAARRPRSQQRRLHQSPRPRLYRRAWQVVSWCSMK